MTSMALRCHFPLRRGKARLRLGIPAQLLSLHGRSRVTLLDLSETGARIRYSGEPVRDVVVEWLGYEAFGKVVRRSGGDLGVRFDDPIAERWVLETRERLPAMARGEDHVTRFAREWAHGPEGPVDPEHGDHRRALLGFRATVRRRGLRRPPSAVRTWLGTARPFLLGGVVLGLVAGYLSIYI
jgi:hypothetical protein